MPCLILKYACSKFLNFQQTRLWKVAVKNPSSWHWSSGNPACVELPAQSVFLHLFLMRTLWLDTGSARVCMWRSVFMCPYVSINVCVCICMSAYSAYTCVKHPEKERDSGGESLSVFVCVCRGRECVYVSRRCVTLANESLRSPAVQGWLD